MFFFEYTPFQSHVEKGWLKMKMNILKEEEELDDELGFMELQHSSDGLR